MDYTRRQFMKTAAGLLVPIALPFIPKRAFAGPGYQVVEGPVAGLATSTATINASTGGGDIQSSSASTCAAAQAGSNQYLWDDSTLTDATPSLIHTNQYYCYRSFLRFNTASLSGKTLVSCTLYLYVATSATESVDAFKGTQSSTLVAGDYGAFTGDSYGSVSCSSTGWKTWTVPVSDVDTSGYTKIVLLDHLDVISGSCSNQQVAFRNAGSSTNKPYLSIVYYP